MISVRIRTSNPIVGVKPQPDSVKDIDWNDSSDRKWLMNHLHHCMMNGKGVNLYPTPVNEPRITRESN